MPEIQPLLGDITTLTVEAVVNAANTGLLGGGGVDGAIHRAAGPQLLEYCRTLGGCPTGEARITPAFRLGAKFIIHAVGPVWHGGKRGECELLTSCYRNSLALATAHEVRSIAFPCISTGVYRFPKALAAETALAAIRSYVEDQPSGLQRIVLCCFEQESFDLYCKLMG
ncbi:MAG: O-acetyl-ADP-ribose deacetylase [Oligoflexia bacterium]|nr:O-acetyl-ADP-ribose deacetylase [Oligoflexia bacterium]